MSKPSVLGRGLGALLNTKPVAPSQPGSASLPLEAIRIGDAQPRRHIDQASLGELAASIKANGVIQPIVVRPIKTPLGSAEAYEIIAGERRWHAAKLAGLSQIPVVVRDLSDQDAVAIALIENIQREQLTPAEEARALQRLIVEFTLTHQEVADVVGRSRAAVSNLIRLLDLPTAVVQMIDDQQLNMGQARALLGVDDDAVRVRLAGVVVARQLSVRETERLVQREQKGEGLATPPKPAQIAIIREIHHTPTIRVELHQRRNGGGKLVIDFTTADVRDALLDGIEKVVQS